MAERYRLGQPLHHARDITDKMSSGQRDQFVRWLQDRYGYEQQIAEHTVDQFAQRLEVPAEVWFGVRGSRHNSES